MYTPAQLVAISNLNNNIGLSANTLMTSLCGSITTSTLINNYAVLQPGTTYGNVLASNSFSVTSLGLPSFVANANTTAVSITTQANKLLPNVQKFTSLVTTLGSFAVSSYSVYNALSELGSLEFDELNLNISDHQSSVTNGISNIFGGTETDPGAITNNLKIFATALENLGTAYDVNNLGKIGDPIVFVKHLINLGFDIPGPATATASPWYSGMTNEEVRAYLDELVGPVFGRVLTLTGIRIPSGSVVLSVGDLLELSKVFPESVIGLIPGKNFDGLANMFVNLGGKFKSFSEIAGLLRSTVVPTLSYLNSSTVPVAASDIANITAQLGSGVGTYGNPTMVDLMGSVAGVPYTSNLTTVLSSISTVSTTANGQSLISSLANLAGACATGNTGFITGNIAIVQNAALSFNNDLVVQSQVGSNSAMSYMQSRLALEQTNLSKAGVDLDNYPVSGSSSVLSFVGSLHDYSVDRNNLKYNELIESTIQTNYGGDAVRAVLAEGKNFNSQAQFSVPNVTKSMQ